MGLQAVIIGSSEFPLMPADMSKSAFAASADGMKTYLCSAEAGLGLRDSQILNLFGSADPVAEQDGALTAFLEKAPQNDGILIYYVGHGGFLTDRQYYLAVKCTDPKRPHITGLKIRDLAMTLSYFAYGRKVYLILDCCFAGAAMSEFMNSDLAAMIETQTYASLPELGTALLVASSKDEPALSPHGSSQTMLAEALLETLRVGSPYKGDLMSLREVAEQTADLIRRKWGNFAVRPEVHTPRQAKGDIADHPLFPNAVPRAKRSRPAERVLTTRYRSAMEEPPFKSWVPYQPKSNPTSRSEIGYRYVDQRPSYGLRALGEEIVGSNLYLQGGLVSGRVRFSYRIVGPAAGNVVFFVIPMKTSEGRKTPGRPYPSVEYGTTSPSDPANGFSEHRLRANGDRVGEWLKAEMHFDFSHLDGVRSIVFGPRINEGTRMKGPGQVFLTDVTVLVYE